MSELVWVRKKTGMPAAPVCKIKTIQPGKELPILTFPVLDSCGLVEHLFTTRFGGVSKGIYATTNLSFGRADDETAVLENYKRFAKLLHTEVENMVCSDQTHTTNIRLVTQEDIGKGIFRKKDYSDVDGLITNIPGICLVTFYADCVPLYLVDPVHKAIGLSHSGWRGTVKRMGAVTLDEMNRNFGTDPRDVLVAIGPSICRACYEVSEDVASKFQKEFRGTEERILQKGRVLPDGEQKWQLDLWQANRQVFLDAGVKEEHMEITDICTCCNSEILFSHRATNGQRGNLGAFLMLKK
ncbi:MAG: peptidoglycan editing factor PgeF [Lachnospiraceae bacterium]|nr:peptidoglycan editing factor PgeF [Lachnospiraceae bacterium]